MTDKDQKLVVIVATYGSETGAGEALDGFTLMEKAGTVELVDVAVVVHDGEGKVHFKEPSDKSGKKLAKRGAIAGGLVGLIFPPSIIAGAVVTGAAGGLWGKIRDKGFKDDELKAVGETLPPGSSAIIAVADEKSVDQVLGDLAGYKSVTQHAMNGPASKQVLAEATATT